MALISGQSPPVLPTSTHGTSVAGEQNFSGLLTPGEFSVGSGYLLAKSYTDCSYSTVWRDTPPATSHGIRLAPNRRLYRASPTFHDPFIVIPTESAPFPFSRLDRPPTHEAVFHWLNQFASAGPVTTTTPFVLSSFTVKFHPTTAQRCYVPYISTYFSITSACFAHASTSLIASLCRKPSPSS